MWALRRAANPLRSNGFGITTCYACYFNASAAVSDLVKGDYCHNTDCCCCQKWKDRWQQKKYCSVCNSSNETMFLSTTLLSCFSQCRSFSSHCNAKSTNKENVWEDSFADLGAPVQSCTSDIGDNFAELGAQVKTCPAVEDSFAELGAQVKTCPAVEDSFAELGAPVEASTSCIGDDKDLKEELTGVESEEECEGDVVDEISFLDSQTDVKTENNSKGSSLSTVIIAARQNDVSKVLEKWIKDGNEVKHTNVFGALGILRRRRSYLKALKMLEWFEEHKLTEFDERAHASHLDLIAKVRGLKAAEKHIDEIPEAFRNSEIVYGSLLSNFVSVGNVAKSEEIFNKMRELGFPLTVFSCNHLLLLYKKFDIKKMADVLELMEAENIMPSLFTYKLLVDTKGFSGDIAGIETIIDAMTAQNVQPDLSLQATIARHYLSAGFKDKAMAILKMMEGDDLANNRDACKELLSLHALLGHADEVERIWKVCELQPRAAEYLSAIEAWGKLDKVEKAEELFEEMLKKYNYRSPNFYNVLLNVYASHKLLSKGKELVKRMFLKGVHLGIATLDPLVKLYVQSGEVAKADSVMHKFIEQNNLKPSHRTYLYLLEEYAKQGDVHNSEKIFEILRRLESTAPSSKLRKYQLLLQSYLNAKTPAYGFRERMKADNMFPNHAMAAQLADVDALKKKFVALDSLLD